ncbi:MAG: sulfotransferase [Azospirillaceae bacterium]|nr:sulfotransferase [Azospirillaceae bacterium]
MSQGIRLLMLSAMYENGGNTTHRFLDGHPELFVYPFESQLGTRLVNDLLTTTFPVKYRWPVFALDAAPDDDYRAIIDEEAKTRLRTPNVSKFRDWPMACSDDDRRALFCERVGRGPRSTGGNVGAFFQATFDSWRDFQRTGAETVYVGYSPIIVVDALRIFRDMPRAHVLHVVRNPWSAYADTKKRPVPMSLDAYMLAWVINQYHAFLARERCPDRVHIVRLEDVLTDPTRALAPVLSAVGVAPELLPGVPSWNRRTMTEVYPWGTIRLPTPAANRATAAELSKDEVSAVAAAAGPYLDILDYRGLSPS